MSLMPVIVLIIGYQLLNSYRFSKIEDKIDRLLKEEENDS